MPLVWDKRADEAQRALDTQFWNPSIRMYNIAAPCPDGKCNTIFHYWWMAHAAENLIDAYVRTGDNFYKERLAQLYVGLLERNGGTWINELYDDMEWMALAWLRAWDVFGEEKYLEAVRVLWHDIKGGWNGHCGGGIAWRKTQLDYKNTPANAPAVILAARLYRAFGSEEDLAWALRIYEWQRTHLVDPATGFVWDGMNRLGDGTIDKDWRFTYCQGVYIGAGVELYRSTGDRGYLEDAVRTAMTARAELADAGTGLLPDEGGGDAGLFKGILARYVAGLIETAGDPGSNAGPVSGTLSAWLLANAETMWHHGRSESGWFGRDWNTPPRGCAELSAQLSGVMLLEMAARLERTERSGQ